MAGYHDGRNVFYLGSFDEQMEAEIPIAFHNAIQFQSQMRQAHIDIIINSYGGLAHLAYTIVEQMEMAKSQGIVVRTLVTNTAGSAGSIVAVAGTEGYRYIAKTANHIVHYGSTGSEIHSPEQAIRNHNANTDFFKTTLNHYKKYCDIPDLEKNLVTDDWYITAAQAKKWKMADHFLDKFIPL